MSEISADVFDVRGGLLIGRLGAETPIDIPASGILQVHSNDGASITLGGGGATQLLGIEFLDELDAPMVLNVDQAAAKFFRVAPGVSIEILHNRAVDLLAQAIPEEQRIATSSGQDFMLEVINSQAFYAYSITFVGFRWGFTDRQSYVPANALDWQAPVPRTLTEMGDRLAAAVAGLLGGAIP
jgi:hypothetical protein